MAEIQNVNAVAKIMKILTPQYISTLSKSIKNEERTALSLIVSEDLKKRHLIIGDFSIYESIENNKEKSNSNEENHNIQDSNLGDLKEESIAVPSEFTALLKANGVNLEPGEIEKFWQFFKKAKNSEEKDKSIDQIESLDNISFNAFEDIVGVKKEQILKQKKETEVKNSTPSSSEYFLLQQKTAILLQKKLKLNEIIKLYDEGKSADFSQKDEEFTADLQSRGTLLNKKRF